MKTFVYRKKKGRANGRELKLGRRELGGRRERRRQGGGEGEGSLVNGDLRALNHSKAL
jgi:hypothetical protein